MNHFRTLFSNHTYAAIFRGAGVGGGGVSPSKRTKALSAAASAAQAAAIAAARVAANAAAARTASPLRPARASSPPATTAYPSSSVDFDSSGLHNAGLHNGDLQGYDFLLQQQQHGAHILQQQQQQQQQYDSPMHHHQQQQRHSAPDFQNYGVNSDGGFDDGGFDDGGVHAGAPSFAFTPPAMPPAPAGAIGHGGKASPGVPLSSHLFAHIVPAHIHTHLPPHPRWPATASPFQLNLSCMLSLRP